MRRSARSTLRRLYLVAYGLLLLFTLREYYVNSPADLRALRQPFSLEETWQCLLDSPGGRELLAETGAAGLRFVRGDAPVGGGGNSLVAVREARLPLFQAGAYRFQSQEIVLTDEPVTAHLMGCDERAAALAHEMQHALDRAHGLGFDRAAELRAFRRAQAVRDGASFQDASLPPWQVANVDITYTVWCSLSDCAY